MKIPTLILATVLVLAGAFFFFGRARFVAEEDGDRPRHFERPGEAGTIPPPPASRVDPAASISAGAGTGAASRSSYVAANEDAPETRKARARALLAELQRLLDTDDLAQRERGMTEMLGTVMALDPAAAAEFAKSYPGGEVREELLRRVAQQWVTIDAASAIEWMASFLDIGTRTIVVTTGVEQMAITNPAEAVRIAELFEIGQSADDTMAALAQLWAEKDLNAALTWARARQPGESRDLLLARIAFVQAATDPPGAATLVASELSTGAVQTEAVISVVNQWAARDLAGARAWVKAFPVGPLRDRAKAELERHAQLPNQ